MNPPRTYDELLAAFRDSSDFIHAIAEATKGAGRIDERSVMRYGERLKKTAQKLNAKNNAVLAALDGKDAS